MKNARLFKLQALPIPKLRDGFSLDTLVLEQEMQRNNQGVDLATVNSHTSVDESLCRKFVPYFSKFRTDSDEATAARLANNYPQMTSPCSMVVDSVKELAEHMSAGYQLAHFHYILGKKYNLKGDFPNWCCGMSSVALTLSLLNQGYPNAVYACSSKHDHCYTLLPFVHKKRGITGAIVIDPTYDQMWDNPLARNAVFLKLGLKWEYRTDWHSKANLFPDKFCSIDVFQRALIDPWNNGYRNGTTFLKQAFANPVDIKKIRFSKRKSSTSKK